MSTNANAPIDKELNGVTRLVETAAESGEVDMYAGKRTKSRITEGMQLEMTEDLAKKPVAVSMHNISETGCAFWMKRKLELHSTVYLREFTQDDSAPWMPGRVSHCTTGIRGFLVGVAFGAEKP